jgi:Glu-tRNA(Gln) amidotransferase subunit E-like FAD-binding protein
MSYDYSKLGFKSGLEIHQQLDSGKLFCNCPSVLRSDAPLKSVRRKLHAIAGETGDVDVAVSHEASLDKDFEYQVYDTTCLVELDEAPPELINGEALKIVLQIALLLNCEILPVSQVMRKTVIDGSNTSGFQRTVLVARNGWIETSAGRVGIDSVALEEDSARVVSREGGKAVYRLDRLGIPLVEIATAPDLKNAEHVKEAALKLGEILRACKVKRGIGTIRQDVNVSIKGHPRVEIKGFQDVKMFVKSVEREVARQVSSKDGKSEVRNALPSGESEFLRPMPGAARMYPETDLPLLEISRGMINDAKKSLPRLRGEIEDELRKKGLSDEMIGLVLKSDRLEDFKSLVPLSSDADLIAKMLVLWPKDFAKKLGVDVEKVFQRLHLDVLEGVLENFVKGKISRNDLQDVLFAIASGKNVKDALKIEKVNFDEVEEFVRKLVKEKPGLRDNAYMGMVMKEFKGKISGKEVMEIIKKYVKIVG